MQLSWEWALSSSKALSNVICSLMNERKLSSPTVEFQCPLKKLQTPFQSSKNFKEPL